jgi:hypothetical protein
MQVEIFPLQNPPNVYRFSSYVNVVARHKWRALGPRLNFWPVPGRRDTATLAQQRVRRGVRSWPCPAEGIFCSI